MNINFFKGAMSAIFINILKSQKLHFHRWNPNNSSPLLLKVAILVHWYYQQVFLAADGQDGSGLQLEKVGSSSCTV